MTEDFVRLRSAECSIVHDPAVAPCQIASQPGKAAQIGRSTQLPHVMQPVESVAGRGE